jgi:hypothetical protein
VLEPIGESSYTHLNDLVLIVVDSNRVCEVLGVNHTVPLLESTCMWRHITLLTLLTFLSGQVIMSIRCKDSNRAVIIEALRRARYKFPGRQKIIVSKKWGFTSLDRPDYESLKKDKMVINDGAYVQVSETPVLCIAMLIMLQFLKPKGKLLDNLRTATRA